MKPYVYLATPTDALTLAPHLRDDDVRELQAASGLTPLVALTKAVRDSRPAYSIADDDGVFGLFGAVPHPADPQIGIVWMLTSDRLLTHRREFVRQGPRWLAQLHARYPLLWNCVDERNTTHLRWLASVDCEFIARHADYGPLHLPFQEFIHVLPSRHSLSRNGRLRRFRRRGQSGPRATGESPSQVR